MKTAYPSREKDRWEHALTRPLSPRMKFELMELMRADLFEYLDVLTTCPYDNAGANEKRSRDLERIARRLAELTPRRAKALRTALKAGRVEYAWLSDPEAARSPHCDPRSGPMWQQEQEYWQSAQA